MAVNDIYRLVVSQTCSGKDVVNTFYYVESTSGGDDEQTISFWLCKEFYEKIWLPEWKPNLSNAAKLQYIFTNRINPTNDQGQAIPYESENGSISDDPMPNGACGLLSFKGSPDVQNFWRRVYITGLPESACVTGFLTPTVEAALTDLAYTIRSTPLLVNVMGSGVYDACAFSRKRVADAVSPVWSTLVSHSVNKNVRSQRQRNPVSG